MQHPNQERPARPGTLADAQDQFFAAMQAAGNTDKTANTYWRAVLRLEAYLAADRTELATCPPEQLVTAIVSYAAGRRATTAQLRTAVPHALRIFGRDDVAATVRASVPTCPQTPPQADTLTVAEAQAFEAAAWETGGSRQLASLLALHTHLTLPAIASLRWDAFDPETGTLRHDFGTTTLAPHLAHALAEVAPTPAWPLFPGRAPGGGTNKATVWGDVADTMQAAGLEVNIPRLRRTVPPPPTTSCTNLHATAPPKLRNGHPRPPRPRARPGAAGITYDQLLATGAAPRTAQIHLGLLNRAADHLAARGTDLLTCTGVDLAALAADFPPTSARRAQLRGALTRGWEVLGREQTPSLKAIRVPPGRRGRSRALVHDDARRLEQAAWRRHDLPGLAVLLGLYAGLRRAEIATLRWERVTWEHGQAIWLRILGKGDLVADVPVHPALSEALVEHRRQRGWVFPGRYVDTPVLPATVWSWTKIIAAEAGIPDFTTHRLRHTALTEANDASGDLRTVQEIARHSRPETTAMYTRVSLQRMHDVIGMVDYGRPRPDRPEPDPADQLPGLGYRQLVTLLDGEEAAPAWVHLGQVLDEAGWKFEVLDGPLIHWTCPDQPSLSASVGVVLDGVPRFNLFVLGPPDEDWADSWELDNPEQLNALAGALINGVPVPPGQRLGDSAPAPRLVAVR